MRILPILLVPLLLSALPAFAQGRAPGSNWGGGQGGGQGAGRQQGQGAAGQQQQQPAAALPGLAARTAPAPIPADPNRGELSPNAALFDAITRGDLPAARDAVSRGADLDARNVLGLTPVDAAVDQGRNEILFYLLSARGTVRSPGAAPPPQARETPRERQARERVEQAQRAAAERAARQAAAAPPPRDAMPASARLFAGDGGSPRPEIGFLGFDAGRPQGAVAPASERPASRRRGG
ncbi:MAG TPA: ankyrin repeat domain-containing protein [Roseomonas sp.]|jgi:hypothetical protein